MFRTPSLLGPLNSGFVDFASGAPIDSLAATETAEVLARVAAEAPIETLGHLPGAVWAPPNSARIRVVEALALAAICGYFGFGLARALAGL